MCVNVQGSPFLAYNISKLSYVPRTSTHMIFPPNFNIFYSSHVTCTLTHMVHLTNISIILNDSTIIS
jgi:hypothetical protein